jgi:flagellar assembly factor FliW
MNCVAEIETEKPAALEAIALRLPAGLLGFEHMKDYLLIANPAEAPFHWLQVKDDATLAFVVIDPFLVAPDYQPDIPQSDVEALGLDQVADALLLNIVTVHGPAHATVNLKGPIVINRRTRTARQVVIANAARYSVQQPLPLGETVHA